MYRTILADPPWQTTAGRPLGKYKKEEGVQIFSTAGNKSRALAYPTMSVEEICAMPVSEMAEKDAHLYLWTTNQYLLQAQRVIYAWGFRYVTPLTWVKKPMGGGLGGTYRNTTEHLLFCRRGSLKAKKQVIGTWFDVKREYVNGAPCHSRKPEFFRQMIEDVSPGPYLEMFARTQRPAGMSSVMKWKIQFS